MPAEEQDEHRYRAVRSRDARFDGWFVTAVTSTGIYCRPSCPATTPKRANVRFYPTAAAAQQAGFRACKRCRPDASPGSPEWDHRADLVGRAMRLIGDGVVDREGIDGLAARLGYSVRQVHRQLVAAVGAGPQALARAQRAHTARTLIETTGLPFTEVAFAAGFKSVRQFNDTVRQVFASAPTELRRRAAGRREADRPVAAGAVVLRLPYRPPGDLAGTLDFLGRRAVPGVETYDGTTYRRALRLPHGDGVVDLTAGAGNAVAAVLRLADLRDLAAAVARCRRLLDLDADPEAVDAHLAADPLLAALVRARPGVRAPGAVDGAEIALRAVLGQQVTLAAARTLAGRLTARFGEPLAAPVGAVTHQFPVPERLARAADADLAMPAGRRRALRTLSAALAGGDLAVDAGSDREELTRRLLAVPGVGPWTAGYIRLRGTGDPDVFLPADAGVRAALGRAGRGANPGWADRQRPWRSYAVVRLWAAPTVRKGAA
jgi:AraC family transcriptional regulator of adaptative response / DNA-3-methyladenine glycosylase II